MNPDSDTSKSLIC